MSHDALVGLLRRLVARSGKDREERRLDGTDAPSALPADPLLADGGQHDDGDDAHLRDLPDGAGCAEIWEHLSERQVEGRNEEDLASECRADD